MSQVQILPYDEVAAQRWGGVRAVAREDELAGPVESGVACLWLEIMGGFVLVNSNRSVVPVSL